MLWELEIHGVVGSFLFCSEAGKHIAGRTWLIREKKEYRE